MPNERLEALMREVRAQAAAIVRSGRRVNEEIEKLAAESAREFAREAEGLRELARAIMEGAAEGARGSLPEPGESALREVVSGLARGLAISAEAVKLLLQESQGKAKEFAREDLDRIAKEFRALSERFVDIVGDAASSFWDHARDQAQSMREHARRAAESAKPDFEAAARAAKEDPGAFGKEAFAAGSAATKRAAGVFFTELGTRLEELGRKLSEGPDSKR